MESVHPLLSTSPAITMGQASKISCRDHCNSLTSSPTAALGLFQFISTLQTDYHFKMMLWSSISAPIHRPTPVNNNSNTENPSQRGLQGLASTWTASQVCEAPQSPARPQQTHRPLLPRAFAQAIPALPWQFTLSFSSQLSHFLGEAIL